ncbi:ParA family protein [Micromonospora lupini]|uniref:ParA family protein n=1 Tax=Micromonospora lupini TaxID=285679 RepID=UPI0022500D85|nr:ParA family protein [Micromonospora lupini]MCX5070850.1 ParA family protein [Micromonospora lupini]
MTDTHTSAVPAPRHADSEPTPARRRRVYSVINQKGGSTKTTTSINLGAALAARGLRVRVIDTDPQEGSATHWLPPTDRDQIGRGLLDVYADERNLDQATSRTTVPNLYIVPSWTSLRAVEKERDAGSELVLRAALAASEAPIDVEIVDCPHTLDVLAIGATGAADELIIPVQASELDVVGMEELLKMVKKVRARINPDLTIAAIIVGRVKGNSGFDKALLEGFKRDYPDAVVGSVVDSVRMREATAAHQPITVYEPSGRAARDFLGIADQLIARGES